MKIIKNMIGKGYRTRFPFNIAYNIYSILKPKKIKLFGYDFYIPKKRYILVDQLILTKEFEPNQTKLMMSLVNEGDTVLDIGANIGYYTLLLSKLVGETGRVYSFEPEKNNFNLLKKNVEENGLRNVTLFNIAVSNKKECAKLFLSSGNAGGHSLVYNTASKYCTKVELNTLDNLMRDNNKIDLIKIDVEGSERKVFLGAKDILKNHNPLVIGERVSDKEKYSDILDSNKIKYYLFDELDNMVDC